MADQPRDHHYHAEATILSGKLVHPLMQEIKPQTNAKLPDKGGYLSEHSEPYRLEGIISFDRAYTQVAGGEDENKLADGWHTLSTTVIENLNVLEVITADRVVGQIATLHPREGYVPKVHFLGTRIEGLRVAGHPVQVVFPPYHPYHFEKPVTDGAYTRHNGFLAKVKSQFDRVRSAVGVPQDLLDDYKDESVKTEGIGEDYKETIESSLVSHVTVAEGAPDSIRGFGHVLHIRDFGKVYLGLLRVEHWDFNSEGVPRKTLIDLTMLKFKLGCIGSGSSSAGNGIVNGNSYP
jgi:hypothetical protein